MSPEAQRIAIAEACGWESHESPQGVWYYYKPGTFPAGARRRDELPDYINDLNAVHEAENVLRGKSADDEQWVLWDLYRIALEEMAGRDDSIHTTADQRSESFLRTIGKWEDSDV